MSPEWERLAVADERTEAWDAVLTRLEAAVTDGVPPTWVPPTDLGPLPRDMVGRASRLVAAQRDAIAAQDAERASVAAHLGALRTVHASREPTGAVYLDVTG